MFFENFTEESKSNKPCKWVITKHFRINEQSYFRLIPNLHNHVKVGKKLSDARRSEDMNEVVM